MKQGSDAAERELQKGRGAEEELLALFGAMSDAVIVVDREGRYLRIPTTGAPGFMQPRDPSELLGRSMHDVMPAASADFFLEKIQRTIALKDRHTFEYSMESEGRQTWISAAISPLSDEAAVIVQRDISESKRAERELRSWQERHLAMVNSVDAIVWEAKADFSAFTFVSEQAERLLGYPAERWLNESGFWANHIHPEDREWCVNYCEQKTAASEDHDFEYRMVAADGRPVWLRDIVTVVTENVRPALLRGFMIDITELKHASEQLSDQEQEYRSIFESTSDGLVINDLETGVILAANPAFCRMHGYDDMVGVHPAEHIHPDSHHLFQEYVRTVRQGRDFRGRAQDVHRDGSVFDVEVIGRGFTYKGRAAVLGVVRDITEQLRSEQQYRLIFESTTDSLLIHSPEDLRVMDANAAAGTMFGYSREELIGMLPSQLFTSNDPDFADAVKDGRPSQTHAVGLRKDGTTFDVEAAGVPFVFKGRTHLLCVQRDITEQVRSYQLLEQRVMERTREFQRRRAVAEGLRDLIAVVNSERSLEEILEVIVAQCRQLLLGEASTIHIPEPDSQHLLIRAGSGLQQEHTQARLPIAQSATGLAFSKRRPVAVEDVPAAFAASPRETGEVPLFEDAGSHLRVIYLPSGDNPVQSDLQQAFAATYRSFLVIPLASRDHVYGTLTINYHLPREFSDDDISLAMAFADQAAVAIENARLYEQAAERTQELQSLLAVSDALTSTLNLRQLVRIVLEKLQEVVDYKAASLILIEEEDLVVHDLVLPGKHHSGSNTIGTRFPRSQDVKAWSTDERPPSLAYPCVHVAAFPRFWEYMNSGEPVIVHDALTSEDEFTVSYRAVMQRELPGAEFMRSWMAVPLAVRERVIGYVGMSSDRPGYFTDKHASIARAFADHASVAIENARLYEQEAERTRELTAMLSVANSVASTLELRPVLKAVVEQVASVDEQKSAWLTLVEGDEMVLWEAKADRDVPLGLRVPIRPESPILRTLLSGQPVVIADVSGNSEEARDYRESGGEHSLSRGSFLAVPMMIEDRMVGTLSQSHPQSNFYREADVQLVSAIANQAALAIEKARLYEQAQQAAALEERQRLARELHDAVTQTLFSTSLIAEVVPDLWEAKPELARQRLDDLRRLTRGALAEMRTLLVELRPGALTELPLSDLLRQLGEATSGRTNLKVDLQVEVQAPTLLPPEVQVALYRIAQESINNIVRHAQAGAAQIELRYEQQGDVSLRISDDGLGFDPQSIPGGHLGVGIMRERAQAIGASIQVTSSPGSGTTIEVSWSSEKGLSE